ncbi:hypothetical protein P8452_46368 [Trifolium repens]|nr:hypothetical protein P8452_46368 [Trifolium repens]
MNYHPAGTAGSEGPRRAFLIPEWMPMSFRPTKAMKLNYSVTATTAYIFQPDHAELLGREVLIKTNTGVMADRKALKSLEPRAAVDQEQFALDAHKSADYLRELYHDKYMRTSTYVCKMYIPMNDQGRHWYLMVVDFTERKLVWLDSLHFDERDPFRRRAILFMALKLEEIMTHTSFDKDITPCCPDLTISSFSVYTPRHVQQQRPLSNDCGVWICKWMIECPFRSDYGHITVNTATRMKLALLLVRSANNVIKDKVIAKAVKHWEFEKQKRECLVKFDVV